MRQCLALISAFAAVCVRTEGGEKLTQWVFGRGAKGGGVGVFECACMHVNVCFCVCKASGVIQTGNDEKKSTNKVKNPFRKCTKPEVDVDNLSIRVVIPLSEASLHVVSCQSVK